MTYQRFGKLRFLDFFPRTEDYYADKTGGMECPIGLADYEGYGPAVGFASAHASGQTGAIDLDFSNGCPEPNAHNLLDLLGLNLRRGMSGQQVEKALGKPVQEDQPGWPRFVVGERCQYYVDCAIDQKHGLFQLTIYRKDLADDMAK